MTTYPWPKPEPKPPKVRERKPRKPIARQSLQSLSRDGRKWTTAKRSTPVKRKNAKRRVSEFARTYGSRARVRWVKLQFCVCRKAAWRAGENCGGPIDNAHIIGGGAGRKADAQFIVPLCRTHHTDGPEALHRIGRRRFECVNLVDLTAEAAHTQQLWLLHCGREGLDPVTGKRAAGAGHIGASE